MIYLHHMMTTRHLWNQSKQKKCIYQKPLANTRWLKKQNKVPWNMMKRTFEGLEDCTQMGALVAIRCRENRSDYAQKSSLPMGNTW
jgi:hypothetical protein